MMFLVLFFFVLAASTGAVTKLQTVEDFPPIDPSTGLPYGYAKNDIVWSGFESILGDSEATAISEGTVLTGLVINGTVEQVMAHVEGMGFPIKPLDHAAFNAKMTAIEARGGEAEPPTDDNDHMVEYKCNLFAVYARDIHDNCWWDENRIRLAQGEDGENEFKIRVVAGKETAGC
ncbi:hypothetical protein DL768_009706 [Monosporascus sp. mg162]|nr:hypothetical protein DL768_009706 [Monosporascus sp. mg162]